MSTPGPHSPTVLFDTPEKLASVAGTLTPEQRERYGESMSATDSEPTVDLQQILVPIPPVAEVVAAEFAKLRPQFNLTDEQIERLGRRPVAGAKLK